MRPVGRRLPVSVRVLGAALAIALLPGCAAEPITPQAKDINNLYNATMILSAVIFIGINAALLYSVVRYRKRPGDDTLPPQIHGNNTFEVIWTAIPIIIVLAFFAASYNTLRDVDKISSDKELAAIIHVRGYQWFWEFDYGNNVVVSGSDGSTPELIVPAGERVRIVQTSDNVNHAFFVPNFLFKRDLIVGKPNQFEFQVDIPGPYSGQCAELCGTDHAKMIFKLKAVTRAEFDKFIANPPKRGCKGDEKSSPTPEITTPNGQIKFDQQCVVVPADTAVTIKYTNGGGAPHNVAVADDNTGKNLRTPNSKIIESGSADYAVPALPEGKYTFFCQVHPGMQGEYRVVKEGA